VGYGPYHRKQALREYAVVVLGVEEIEHGEVTKIGISFPHLQLQRTRGDLADVGHCRSGSRSAITLALDNFADLNELPPLPEARAGHRRAEKPAPNGLGP
jgi:hypothetical protein